MLPSQKLEGVEISVDELIVLDPYSFRIAPGRAGNLINLFRAGSKDVVANNGSVATVPDRDGSVKFAGTLPGQRKSFDVKA